MTLSINIFWIIAIILVIEGFLPKFLQPTSWFLQIAIKIYQYIISPLLSPCCKFTPTCSKYGLESIKKYGTLRGGILIFWRLIRCNPFTKSDYYDPVP